MYRIPEHVEHQIVDGDIVLMDLKKGSYFGLDRIGSRIWTVIAQGGGLAQEKNAIAEHYGVELARVDADVEALLADLVGKGLLENPDGPNRDPRST